MKYLILFILVACSHEVKLDFKEGDCVDTFREFKPLVPTKIIKLGKTHFLGCYLPNCGLEFEKELNYLETYFKIDCKTLEKLK